MNQLIYDGIKTQHYVVQKIKTNSYNKNTFYPDTNVMLSSENSLCSLPSEAPVHVTNVRQQTPDEVAPVSRAAGN